MLIKPTSCMIKITQTGDIYPLQGVVYLIADEYGGTAFAGGKV